MNDHQVETNISSPFAVLPDELQGEILVRCSLEDVWSLTFVAKSVRSLSFRFLLKFFTETINETMQAKVLSLILLHPELVDTKFQGCLDFYVSNCVDPRDRAVAFAILLMTTSQQNREKYARLLRQFISQLFVISEVDQELVSLLKKLVLNDVNIKLSFAKSRYPYVISKFLYDNNVIYTPEISRSLVRKNLYLPRIITHCETLQQETLFVFFQEIIECFKQFQNINVNYLLELTNALLNKFRGNSEILGYISSRLLSIPNLSDHNARERMVDLLVEFVPGIDKSKSEIEESSTIYRYLSFNTDSENDVLQNLSSQFLQLAAPNFTNHSERGSFLEILECVLKRISSAKVFEFILYLMTSFQLTESFDYYEFAFSVYSKCIVTLPAKEMQEILDLCYINNGYHGFRTWVLEIIGNDPLKLSTSYIELILTRIFTNLYDDSNDFDSVSATEEYYKDIYLKAFSWIRRLPTDKAVALITNHIFPNWDDYYPDCDVIISSLFELFPIEVIGKMFKDENSPLRKLDIVFLIFAFARIFKSPDKPSLDLLKQIIDGICNKHRDSYYPAELLGKVFKKILKVVGFNLVELVDENYLNHIAARYNKGDACQNLLIRYLLCHHFDRLSPVMVKAIYSNDRDNMRYEDIDESHNDLYIKIAQSKAVTLSDILGVFKTKFPLFCDRLFANKNTPTELKEEAITLLIEQKAVADCFSDIDDLAKKSKNVLLLEALSLFASTKKRKHEQMVSDSAEEKADESRSKRPRIVSST